MGRKARQVELEFLGTGTSVGIPMPGCACPVCRSADPRDNRLRASVLVRNGRQTLVVDTGPEFRIQCLRANVMRLDAVLLTHHHADHFNGFDDVRPYCFKTGREIPVWANRHTLAILRRQYAYIWNPSQKGGGLPLASLHEADRPFEAAGLRVTPVPIKHGILDILGYRIGDLAYLTDVSEVPESSLPLLEGLATLIVSAVRKRPHETHFHLAAVKQLHKKVRPGRTLVTHISHYTSHRELVAELPVGINPAQDGQKVAIRPE